MLYFILQYDFPRFHSYGGKKLNTMDNSWFVCKISWWWKDNATEYVIVQVALEIYFDYYLLVNFTYLITYNIYLPILLKYVKCIPYSTLLDEGKYFILAFHQDQFSQEIYYIIYCNYFLCNCVF